LCSKPVRIPEKTKGNASDIHFECPHCKKSLVAPKKLMDTTVNCPSCDAAIQLQTSPVCRPTPQPSANKKENDILPTGVGGKQADEWAAESRRMGCLLKVLKVWLFVMVVGVPPILIMIYRSKAEHSTSTERITTTRARIVQAEQAVMIFAMKNSGKLPDTLEVLTVNENGNPGLLKKNEINDSWGKPFGFSKTGKRCKIISAGPDGEIGTEDDITN